MRHRQPTHPFRQIAILARPDHQMPVIGHQTIPQQTHRQTILCLSHHTLEGSIVRVVIKQPHPPNPTVDDVINQTAHYLTKTTWHARKDTKNNTKKSIMTPDPFSPPNYRVIFFCAATPPHYFICSAFCRILFANSRRAFASFS